jgi:tripartite-type tricarboxylate transporter receptor subunit TctC
MIRFPLAALAAATFALLLPPVVHAQLPKTGIRLLVPFAATGPIDFSARVLAEGMRANLGIPVIVDNRVGANGAIAAVAVKNGPTDGSLLLVATSGMLTISPHIEKDLPYDAEADFTALAPMTYVDVTLAVGAQLGVKNLKEFVEVARKANPPLAIGSFGIGNISHGWLELFKDAAKINLLHVPYKGAAPAFADVLAGRIAGTFPAFSIAGPHLKSGKVIALGVVGTVRSPMAPDVPTLAEQGYPGIDFLTWNALMGPRGMPREVVAAIRSSAAAALKSAEVRDKLIAAGITPWLISPDEFSRSVGAERDRWRRLIVERKIFGEQ